MKKAISLFCALCLCFGLFTFTPITAQAADVKHSGGSIVGIDYRRLYEGDSSNVEFILGEVRFVGRLMGGLSRGEINKIIERAFDDYRSPSGNKMTQADIITITTAARLLSQSAKEYWGKELIAGVLKFLPSIPGYGWDDLYKLHVYGEEKEGTDVALDILKDQAVDAVKDRLQGNAMTQLKRLAKTGGKTSRYVPLLGQLVTTLEVAHEWTGNHEQFEKYLKLVEAGIGEVGDFYGYCNRRINDELEKRRDEQRWRIVFDRDKCRLAFELWGIGGNVGVWTLTGELFKDEAGGSAAGVYEGDLFLEMEGVNLTSSFDARFINTSNPGVVNQIALMTAGGGGNMEYSSKPDSPTVIYRSIVWNITATVPEGSGQLTLQINAQKNKDEQKVSINQTVEGYSRVSQALTVSERWDEIKVVATSVDASLCTYRQWTAYKDSQKSWSKTELDKADTIWMYPDPGTVWRPLESNPKMTVHLR